MFLCELGSSNRRFKTLRFHEGMSVLLADKIQGLEPGDSRNGTGETSLVRIPHYPLDERLDDSPKPAELVHFSFWGDLEMENIIDGLTRGVADVKRIECAIKPQTKVRADGVSTSINTWKSSVSQLLRLPADVDRPTVSRFVSQLVRDYPGDPLKTFAVKSTRESGTGIGYLLGFTPGILAKAGEASALEKSRKALKEVIAEGALGNVSMDEPELHARLAKLRQHRLRPKSKLPRFCIDEQYAEHQAETDRLTRTIRNLNDEGLVLEQHKRDPELTMQEERPMVSSADMAKQLETVYVEIGIVLPDVAARRLEEMTDFHSSVVRNRRLYLESERVSVLDKLKTIEAEHGALDRRRTDVMNLLNNPMAPEAFHNAGRELVEVDSTVADLERRLELVQLVNDARLRLRLITVEAEANVRAEMIERGESIEETISLFQQLGEEICDGCDVSLFTDANKGILKVIPEIDGDASSGIRGVKIFLLDVVCLVMAIKAGRASRILAYDSPLFDPMDDRRVASCLNIRARPTGDAGSQCIVTFNSDRLQAAKAEGFDRRDYAIDPALADVDEGGGLPGFCFK